MSDDLIGVSDEAEDIYGVIRMKKGRRKPKTIACTVRVHDQGGSMVELCKWSMVVYPKSAFRASPTKRGSES